MLYFHIDSVPPSEEDIKCEFTWLNKEVNTSNKLYSKWITLSFILCAVGLALICIGALISIFAPDYEFRAEVALSAMIPLVIGVLAAGIFADKRAKKEKKYSSLLDGIDKLNREQSKNLISLYSSKKVKEYCGKVRRLNNRSLVKFEYYMLIDEYKKDSKMN